MISEDVFNTKGEHAMMLPGAVGDLEVIVHVPADCRTDYLAFLGHPHSLQGGTMNNKVVTTLVRSFASLSIPSVRFNFRGVGKSQGQYDAGIGESDDMLALVQQFKRLLPQAQCLFAGFSFGSFVAYRAAALHDHQLLISVAPPVHHYDYTGLSETSASWVVIQGTEDEVVPVDVVRDFFANPERQAQLLFFNETGHFFHGKLVELKSRLTAIISECLER